MPTPRPRPLAQSIRHRGRDTLVPALADATVVDLDVPHRSGRLVVQVAQPGDDANRPAVSRGGAQRAWRAQVPAQRRICVPEPRTQFVFTWVSLSMTISLRTVNASRGKVFSAQAAPDQVHGAGQGVGAEDPAADEAHEPTCDTGVSARSLNSLVWTMNIAFVDLVRLFGRAHHHQLHARPPRACQAVQRRRLQRSRWSTAALRAVGPSDLRTFGPSNRHVMVAAGCLRVAVGCLGHRSVHPPPDLCRDLTVKRSALR